MQTFAKFLLCILAALPGSSVRPAQAEPEPDTGTAMKWLKAHRLSEEEFIRMSRAPGILILDVSDRETYRLLHIAGAVHLTKQELENAGATLGRVIDKETPILIYENNNYRTVRHRFDTGKLAAAEFSDAREWSGENIAVYRTLYRQGFHRVYELAPYIRIDRSKLPLVASMSSVDLGQFVTLSLAASPVPAKPFLP